MNVNEIQKHIVEHAIPHMKEAGVEAFSLIAYVKDGEGNLTKICLTDCGQNIAYQDALRPVTAIMAHWAMQNGNPPGIQPLPPDQPS